MSDDPRGLMYSHLGLCEEIDRISSRMRGEGKVVFGKLSFPLPKMSPPSLGFLSAVSWMYALYFEAGRAGVRFLNLKSIAFNLNDGNVLDHISRVQQLRTYLQHYLDQSSAHDKQIEQECELWMKTTCGTPVPSDDEHWLRCLSALIAQSLKYLEMLQRCLRSIEQDESCTIIVAEWEVMVSRYHPPHQFDSVIEIVANDIGRSGIDVVKIRKRFYDKWISELNNLQGEYDFLLEARKLIEHALLHEITPVLPITGTDILRSFEIQPGPRVAQLLEAARKLYDKEPCDKNELIKRLMATTAPPPVDGTAQNSSKTT